MLKLSAKRGRPKKADPLQVAIDYLIRGLPAAQVARLHGITLNHTYVLVRRVRNSSDPEALEIQRLLGSQQRSA